MCTSRLDHIQLSVTYVDSAKAIAIGNLTRSSANADKPSRRYLEASQGHQTRFHVRYGFLLVLYSNFVPKTTGFEIFTFEKYRDLETGVRVTEGD